MANVHRGKPFSARIPEDVLTRWRSAVAENSETQTAALIAMMTDYAERVEQTSTTTSK